MGCPVICSRIEGNVDIVEDGKTGLIFEVKSETELYSKMQFAIYNVSLLNEYAVTLRRHIEEHYDQPVVQSLLHNKYLQLLEK
ncbi:MAG: hypothetical protein IPM85_14310 [Chitinophagaceae bacterium]|nr:hypothetical protein [Chitinophagaceae bacterium]